MFEALIFWKLLSVKDSLGPDPQEEFDIGVVSLSVFMLIGCWPVMLFFMSKRWFDNSWVAFSGTLGVTCIVVLMGLGIYLAVGVLFSIYAAIRLAIEILYR